MNPRQYQSITNLCPVSPRSLQPNFIWEDLGHKDSLLTGAKYWKGERVDWDEIHVSRPPPPSAMSRGTSLPKKPQNILAKNRGAIHPINRCIEVHYPGQESLE